MHFFSHIDPLTQGPPDHCESSTIHSQTVGYQKSKVNTYLKPYHCWLSIDEVSFIICAGAVKFLKVNYILTIIPNFPSRSTYLITRNHWEKYNLADLAVPPLLISQLVSFPSPGCLSNEQAAQRRGDPLAWHRLGGAYGACFISCPLQIDSSFLSVLPVLCIPEPFWSNQTSPRGSISSHEARR